MANHGASTDPHLTQVHRRPPGPRSPHLDARGARQAQPSSMGVQHHKLSMCHPPSRSPASPRIVTGRRLWSGPAHAELREGERLSHSSL